MIKDKILNLINLCLEVQSGKDGNIESRISETNSEWDYAVKGPTVVISFFGHTAELEIQIFNEGWSYENLSSKAYEMFAFYLDKDIDPDQFLKCKTLLENLVEKQREQEEES